jgi:hypothetical protein
MFVQANAKVAASVGSPGTRKLVSHFRFTGVLVSWLSSTKQGGYISSENFSKILLDKLSWSLDNLQPLWATDNRKKSDKINGISRKRKSFSA